MTIRRLSHPSKENHAVAYQATNFAVAARRKLLLSKQIMIYYQQ
jgi:hypothetical protein